MGIKKLLIFACFICGTALAQRMEVQRKFDITNVDSLRKFIVDSGELGDFKSHFHSEYTFYDIYLDTPDNDLYKQKLSLRLRKKVLSDSLVYYVFQLKSEMDNLNGVRMEVEEPELDYHRLKFREDIIHLDQLLDIIFDHYFRLEEAGDVEDRSYYLALIRIWIQARVNSTIAPFQKLKHLDNKLFTEDKISELDVRFIGKSKRKRSHIYSTNQLVDKYGLRLQNRVSQPELPIFFIKNPNFIWLMESSLDSSFFYHADEPFALPKIHISEYEVENKYEHDTLGIELLNKFEHELLQKFKLVKSADSKYRQCVNKKTN